MHRTIATALAISLGCAVAPAVLLAQDGAALSNQQVQANQQVQEAERLGSVLYAYDQVAWHGTDAFMADIERTGMDTSWLRGFLVLPDDAGALWAVFFGERDGVLVAAARYRVEGSTVKEGGPLAEADIAPLSPDAVRMANLRQSAFAAMVEQDYGMCARSNPNTIVLPPTTDGSITVYVMTPPTSDEDYPLGGHYRFTFDAADRLQSHRRFLNSCFAIPRALQAPPGEEDEVSPVGMFVSHLLDDYPTEIHFFASRYVPLTLMVGTMENETMWSIAAGELMASEPFPDYIPRP